MIKYGDYDTPLPDVDPVGLLPFFLRAQLMKLLHKIEECSPWKPTSTAHNINYPPVAGRIMSSFCASAKLGESVYDDSAKNPSQF